MSAIDPQFDSRGLPRGALKGRRLCFDLDSGTLLLGGSWPRDGMLLPDLYLRAVGQPAYTRVVEQVFATLDENVDALCVSSWFLGPNSVCGCVVDRARPRVFVETSRSESNKTAVPLDFYGVLRVRLLEMQAEFWSAAEMGPNLFASEIVGMAAGGQSTYAVVGMLRPAQQTVVDYALAELHWSSRKVDILHLLDDAFG
jgi:hypothetical protein